MERSSDGGVPGCSKRSESPGKSSNASSSSNSRLSRYNRKRKTAVADCSQILTPRKYFSGSSCNIPPMRMIPLNNVEEVRPKQVRIIVIESSSDGSDGDDEDTEIESGEKTKEVNPSQKSFPEEVVVTVKLQASNASKNKAVREDNKTKITEESEPKSSTSRGLVDTNGITTVDLSSSNEDTSGDDEDMSDEDGDMSEDDEDISEEEEFSESDEEMSEDFEDTSESDDDESNSKKAFSANRVSKGGLSSSNITIDIASDDDEGDETNNKTALTGVESSSSVINTKDPPPSTITSKVIISEDDAEEPTRNQTLAEVEASTKGLPSANDSSKEAMSEGDKDETSNQKSSMEVEASSLIVTTNVVTTEDMDLPSSNLPSIEIIIEDGVNETSNKNILTEGDASSTKDLPTANDSSIVAIMTENNQDETSNKETLKETSSTTSGVNTGNPPSTNDSINNTMDEDDEDGPQRNQTLMEAETSSSLTTTNGVTTEDLPSANDSSNESISGDETNNENKKSPMEAETSSSLVTTNGVSTEVLDMPTLGAPSIEIIIEVDVDDTHNKETLTEEGEASSSLITINGVNNKEDMSSSNDSINDTVGEDDADKTKSNETLENMETSSSWINKNSVNTKDLSPANDSSNEPTSEDETSNEKAPTEVEASSSLITSNGISSNSDGRPSSQEVQETVEEIVNIVVNAEETNSNDNCTIEIEPGSLLFVHSNTQVEGLCAAVFCGESSSPTFLSTCYPMMNAEDMKRLTVTSDEAQNDSDKSTYRVLELTNLDQTSIHSAETPESFVSSNDSLVVVSDSAPPTPTRESPILTLSTEDMLRDGILAVMQEFDLI